MFKIIFGNDFRCSKFQSVQFFEHLPYILVNLSKQFFLKQKVSTQIKFDIVSSMISIQTVFDTLYSY